jgi:CHAT domain-containing protein
MTWTAAIPCYRTIFSLKLRAVILVLAFAGFLAGTSQDISTAEQLAAAIVGASADEDRARLLEAHAGLVTNAQVAAALNQIGVRYGSGGNYAKALEYLQRSLTIYEKLGDEDKVLDQQINIGNVFRWQRDFAQALTFQRRVLAAAEARGDKRRIALPTINIAFILQEQGDTAGAIEHFEKGLALMRELNDQVTVAYVMSSLATSKSLVGRRAEAIALYRDALQIQEALGNKAGAAFTLGSLAYLESSEGRPREAIVLGNRALALAEEIGARETLWRVHTNLGNSHVSVAEYANARSAYERAIETIEGMRKELVGGELEQQRFFADKLEPYWGMLAVASKEKKAAEALAHAERAKARILLDVARSGRSRITQAMTDAEREREAALRGAVAAANADYRRAAGAPTREPAALKAFSEQRDRALLDYQRFETVLYATHPELKVKRGEAEWSGVEATAALIDDRTAVVEFAVTSDRTYGFVLTRGGNARGTVHAWTIDISSQDLAARTEKLRRSLESRDLGFRAAAREMYTLLLAPAAAHLAGKQTLIVVPDRVLWELPFQALDTGKRYLLEDHAILYAASMAVIAAARHTPRAAATTRVLAIGDTSLPHAPAEVRTLATIYGPPQTTVWMASSTTEAQFKKEAHDYSVIHFATHGVRDDRNAIRSHLLLTQRTAGNVEDGTLEAWEFMQMTLSANLIVLSACETALGRVGDGEGMIGLTWALFIAGSPSVVASQWRVESTSTTDLIIGFHRDLATNRAAPPSSLRAAQALRASALRLLRGGAYSHPFYWAGFVTIGTRL